MIILFGAFFGCHEHVMRRPPKRWTTRKCAGKLFLKVKALRPIWPHQLKA